MERMKFYLSLLMFTLFTFPFCLMAESLQLGNGWSFSYMAIGNNIVLTEVETSGNEKLIIPSTVDIGGETYTITALKSGLFANNANLKKITIPQSCISLGAEINSESPDKPSATGSNSGQFNVTTLNTSLKSSNIWEIKAMVSTEGVYYNSWGVTLLSTGSNPIADTYPDGGFQFWTSSGGGSITLKCDGSSKSFSSINLSKGDERDLSISVLYNASNQYTITLGLEETTETQTINIGSLNEISQLSSSILPAGNFSQLEVNTLSIPQTAGSLLNASNLSSISVDPGNPVYSSIDGSLYDKSGENILIDLSDKIEIANGWFFNYEVLGTKLILTKVVTSGSETLTIPSTVDIDGKDYTIIALKSGLFAGNEFLKEITISSVLTSLNAEISSQKLQNYPSVNNPITLATPIEATDIWKIEAVVNTAGEYAGDWGTGLLATGTNPSTNSYDGGFQFWLNNGINGPNNNTGTLTFKYNGSTTTNTANSYILAEDLSDLALSLAFDGTNYTVNFAKEVNEGTLEETKTLTAAFSGFSQLSSATKGSFSKLKISTFTFSPAAGSLLNAPNLSSISVSSENPVYSSINGYLYDKTGINALLQCQWQGTTSDWDESSNWLNNVLPAPVSNVIIAKTTAPALSRNITVASLLMEEGAEINLNGNALTVADVTVNKKAALNSDKKWLPIGFPFAAQAHCYGFLVHENEGWTSDLDPADGTDYWLRSYSYTTKHDFSQAESAIAANTAYIAQFPDYHVEAETAATDGNSGPGFSVISFVSEGKVTFETKSLVSATNTNYSLTANYNPYTITAKATDNDYYWVYNAKMNNFVLVEEDTPIQPFESFITKTKENGSIEVPTTIALDSDEFTNIEGIVSDKTVVETHYFNLQGVEIQKPTETGIFVVKETLNSGEERTRKIVNTKK